MTESQWPIGQGVFDPSIPTVPPGHRKHQSWQSSKVSFERYFQAQYKCAKIFHKFIIAECFNIYQCNYQCHYRITNKIIQLPIYFINFPRKIIYFDQLSQHSVIPVQWIQEQFKYWEMSFAHMNVILPGQKNVKFFHRLPKMAIGKYGNVLFDQYFTYRQAMGV